MKKTVARLVIIAAALASLAAAQLPPSTADDQMGFKAYQSLHGGDIDSIDVASGSVMLHIPLLSYPQRGGKLSLSWSIRYNGKPLQCCKFLPDTTGDYWDTYIPYTTKWYPGPYVADDDAVSYSLQRVYHRTIPGPPPKPVYRAKLSVITADRATHVVGGTSSTYRQYSSSPRNEENGPYRALDTSGWYFNFSDPNNPVATSSSGVRHYLSGYETRREDPNGNFISYDRAAGTVTDTLGRIVPLPPSESAGSCAYWVPPGTGQGFKLCWINLPITTPRPEDDLQGQGAVFRGRNMNDGSPVFPNGYTKNVTVLESITLPNETKWRFEYNDNDGNPAYNYGSLTKVIFPTGGSISYTYLTVGDDPTSGCDAGSRHVHTRTVDANDGTGSKTWTYNGGVVTDPDGNDTVYSFAGFTGNWDQRCGWHEIERKQFRGNKDAGALLQTIQTAYQLWGYTDVDSAGYGKVPTTTTTTLNGQTKKVTRTYDTGFSFTGIYEPPSQAQFGKVLSETEFDYGPGAPGPQLRSTSTAYVAFVWPTYLNNNMLDLVDSVRIFDGSSNLTAYTQYGYDEQSTQPTGIMTQHNASVYGNNRGNLVRTSKWLNSDGSYAASTSTFNDTGTVKEAKDAGLHSTTYSYDTRFAGAYPTQVCNALNQCSAYDYDLVKGLVTQITDPNQQVTTFEYDDMFRLVRKRSPGDAEFTLGYNDSAPPVVTIQVKQDEDRYIQTDAIYDGLGRLRKTVLTDSEGTVYTRTRYDKVGRKEAEWNPTRCDPDSNPDSCAGENTFGKTSFTYDALGRTLTATYPDGNIASNTYVGSCTTACDPTGRPRKSCTDGAGRLTAVYEPEADAQSISCTSALPYETAYQYDSLNNLRRVDQKGNAPSSSWRTRTFVYDSLSRLTSSTNPEAGTIGYNYDLDGNLLSRVGPTSTITYTPDALHRITSKCYPNTSQACVSYHYDSDDWSIGTANAIGRLVSETTTVTNSRQEQVTIGHHFAYDPAGRIAVQHERLPEPVAGDPCSTSNPCATSAMYDSAGHQTALSYPSGRHVSTGYDSVGRLSGVTFDRFGSTSLNYPYLTVSNHYPAGAPHVSVFGNGLSESTNYNNRMQLTQLTTSSGALTAQDLAFDYLENGLNNGNVIRTLDQLNGERTQTLTYDNLNRLKTASVPNDWGFSYSIDPWGNLTQQTLTKGTGRSYAYTATNNNQLVSDSVFQYDTAGNMLRDGNHSYAYDPENRIAQVDPDQQNGTALAKYLYDAEGHRISKQSAGEITEYLYFGGQPIAEKRGSDWSDYIFAGGKRVARADNYADEIHIYGNNCSGCGAQTSYFGLAVPSWFNSHSIQSGDALYVRQWQDSNSRGGMALWFSDGTTTNGNARDDDSQLMNDDSFQNVLHYRRFDLSQHTGKTVTGIKLVQEQDTGSGSWAINYGDIVFRKADGTVVPIFTGQPNASVVREWGSSGSEQHAGIFHMPNYGTAWQVTTTYYHGDHLGTSRLLTNGNGYPVWQGVFQPYGEEWNPQTTVNNYKFTGKERDAETGLDYFEARYYGSTMGRMQTPDPMGMGAARLTNPQSLNLYSYGWNNPLRYTDPTGMYVWDKSNNCRQGDQKCIGKANRRLEKEHEKVRAWLRKVDAAVEHLKKSGADPAKIQKLEAARQAIGQEGEANGVVIGSTEQAQAQGFTIGATASMATLRPDQADGYNYYIAVNFSGGLGNANMRGTDIAHEGTHVDEYPLFNIPGVLVAPGWRRSMEQSGYETSAWTAEGLGMRSLSKRGIEMYHRGWDASRVDSAIDQLLDLLNIQ